MSLLLLPTAAPAEGTAASASAPMTATSAGGYWLAARDGGVFSFGDAPFFGSAGNLPLAAPIVGMTPTATGRGYWLVAADGGVFSYGDADFFGSAATLQLQAPIVGMASTWTGRGYWLAAADGRVYPFGDAPQLGSVTGRPNAAVVGIVADPHPHGYWLVASDGGVFTFGDARFYGSTGGMPLNQPIVGMVLDPDGDGYWLAAADGGVFAFGAAGFYGSTGGNALNAPVVTIATTSPGGYWLAGSDGGVFAFGAAGFRGSTGDRRLNAPIVAMVANPFSPVPDHGLLMVRDLGLFVLSSDGSTISRLRVPASEGETDEDISYGAWSRDRRWLAVAHDLDKYGTRVHEFPAAGGSSFQTAFGYGVTMSFSPDGSLLAYSSNAYSFPEIAVVVRNRDGTIKRCISECGGTKSAIDGVDWSPDGNHIAYGLRTPSFGPDAVARVITVDPDGANRRERFEGAEPAWSPDGARIAYVVRNEDGTSDIWIANIDGASAQRLTSMKGTWHRPVWSPDGRQLAADFYATDVSRSTAWVMSSDGTNTHQLTGRPQDSVVAWR